MFIVIYSGSVIYHTLRIDSASNRNEYQESLKIKKPGGKVRLVRRADNLAAIY
jgi:hypothetical protein